MFRKRCLVGEAYPAEEISSSAAIVERGRCFSSIQSSCVEGDLDRVYVRCEEVQEVKGNWTKSVGIIL
jgi:hypothetical protein